MPKTKEELKAIKRENSKKWRLENPEKYKEQLKRYRQKNKAKILEKAKEYNARNREKVMAYNKEWREKNRERERLRAIEYRQKDKEIKLKKRRERQAQRKKEDPIFKFYENVRSNINHSFKRGEVEFTKNNKTKDILGCSFEYFREYILSKCPIGITLKDFGKYGYHIDHIIPISIAKTEDEVIKLCHYTNFQPLWWKDNITKRDKILTNNA